MSRVPALDAVIRKVPDFPKPGILFYDITSILLNPKSFYDIMTNMVELYWDKNITAVAAIESRGFIFASPFAVKMGLPLILVRKKGKLPGNTVSKKYALEYGEAEIEVHTEDIPKGGNILLVDDLIATGGTLRAAIDLFRENGAKADHVFGVVGLPFLNYDKILSDVKVETLINYEGENC